MTRFVVWFADNAEYFQLHAPFSVIKKPYGESCRCLLLLVLRFRQVCEKYLHDATGAKGIRLLEKWVKAGDTAGAVLPRKVAKLFYIIIRLLQNAS